MQAYGFRQRRNVKDAILQLEKGVPQGLFFVTSRFMGLIMYYVYTLYNDAGYLSFIYKPKC